MSVPSPTVWERVRVRVLQTDSYSSCLTLTPTLSRIAGEGLRTRQSCAHSKLRRTIRGEPFHDNQVASDSQGRSIR